MLRRLLAVVCIAVLAWAAGCGESSKGPGSDKDMAGAIKVFNGKDLTGWEATGGAKWVVEDGMLIGTQ
ncbi:MAG TPA: hypothetical protein VMW24_03465, partial [Sedimentisphaerales bacterium]|nr:hypothetical protein [Sedimentisphaerales bacterium]